MNRSDDFFHYCKKIDRNINIIRINNIQKDKFLIKSSELYTKLFSYCAYINSETLKKYDLFIEYEYIKERKKKILNENYDNNKENLIYCIKSIAEEIKLLEPKNKIHNNILICLNSLLNTFAEIINLYENNANEFQYKINKYISFYFYDVNNIELKYDYLTKINNYIYSNYSFSNSLSSFDFSFLSDINVKDNEKLNLKNEEINNSFPNKEIDINKKEYDHLNTSINNKKKYTNYKEINEKNLNNKKNVAFNIEEENKNNEYSLNNVNDNLLQMNQKLDYKKYVDLFEKEESNYIMETKQKITKISNLMNIFVNKIYEQNENIKMIENVFEECTQNIKQGNTYLNKIQKKKSFNSIIFYILIFTAMFLFIFDLFR